VFVQRLAGDGQTADLADQIEAAAGSGRLLDSTARLQLEQGMGADFGGVRIHDDRDADSLARAVDAAAFTTGRDIFFRSGAYRPGSGSGMHLLAHEATHVAQQAAGRVNGTPMPNGVSVSDPSDSFERAADAAAERAIARLAPSARRPPQGRTRPATVDDRGTPCPARATRVVQRWGASRDCGCAGEDAFEEPPSRVVQRELVCDEDTGECSEAGSGWSADGGAEPYAGQANAAPAATDEVVAQSAEREEKPVADPGPAELTSGTDGGEAENAQEDVPVATVVGDQFAGVAAQTGPEDDQASTTGSGESFTTGEPAMSSGEDLTSGGSTEPTDAVGGGGGPGIVQFGEPAGAGSSPGSVDRTTQGVSKVDVHEPHGLLGQIFFPTEVSSLDSNDMAELDKLVSGYLPKLNAAKRPKELFFHGFADHRFTREHNLNLSEERAETVRTFVKERFFDHPMFASRILGSGVHPESAAAGSTAADLIPFRRVDIHGEPVKEEPSGSPAPTAPIVTDDVVVAAAKSQRDSALLRAFGALVDLEALIASGVTPLSGNATVDAVAKWLLAKPDSPGFGKTVSQARKLVQDNLTVQAVIRIDRTQKKDFAHVGAIGDPSSGVTIEDPFFGSSVACRREVMAHEFFHLSGLRHHYGTTKTAEALDCPHHMAELVFEIATGETEGCSKPPNDDVRADH
jgi:outer membrane protein OmpA-like peptidoglycan-associated protein